MSGRGPWVLHRFRIGCGSLLLLYLNKKYVLGEGVSPSSTPFLNIPFAVLPFSGCLDFVSLKLARGTFFVCVRGLWLLHQPTIGGDLRCTVRQKKDNLRTAEWVSFKLLFFHIFLLLRDFFGYFCEYIWNDLNNFYLLLGISIALTRRARPCIRKGIIHLGKNRKSVVL